MSLKKAFLKRVILLTGLSLLISAISFLGEYHYIFELLTHFRVQYLVFFFITSLVFIIFLNKRWLLLSLFGLMINTVPVLALYIPVDSDTTGKKNKMSMLLTNVLSSNQYYAALLDQIEIKQADIIVVLELSPQWADKLKILEKKYPYQKVIPRTDNFGIALYSKYSFEEIKTVDFANNGIPSIVISIQINDDKLNIIATHPLPPLGKLLVEQQNLHIENLTRFTRSIKEIDDDALLIIAGDLNSTPWSPLFKKFVKDTNLNNTRQGKGIYPSWPDYGFIGYLFQIPLDHILVTENIVTKKFEKLDSINSDHFPIYVELEF